MSAKSGSCRAPWHCVATALAAWFVSDVTHAQAPQAGCPDDARITALLKLSGDWQRACRQPVRGQAVLAAARGSAGMLELIIATVRADGQVNVMSAVIDGSERSAIAEVAKLAEDWTLDLQSRPIGGFVPVRVTARWGEDLAVAQEIVFLFDLSAGAPRQVWCGLGSRLENRFDHCLLRTDARFRVMRSRLLRTVVATRRLVPAELDAQLAKQVRSQCRAAPRSRRAFPLPAAP